MNERFSMSSRPTRLMLGMLAVSVSAAFALASAASAEGLAISASSTGSSASSAGSASLRGSSNSLRASSPGSDETEPDDQVRKGAYRIQDVTPVAGRDDVIRLTMVPADAARKGGLTLDLPKRAVDGRPLQAGDTITARERVYGIELTRGQPHEAFFLLVDADVERDLETRPVTVSAN